MILKNKIIILGLVSCVFYSLLAYIPFGFHTLSTPPLNKNILFFQFLINIGLFLIYLVAFQNVKKASHAQSIIKVLILFTVVFSIILLFIPSIGSADIFNYIFRARVFTVYNKNPYLIATENYTSDLFYNFSPKEWNYLPMQYGPFWTSISIGFSFTAKDSFFWNQFLYKLLAILANFGIMYFIWKIFCLIKSDYKIKGLLLYAWNPLVLFEVANNAHNDILMIFFVIASIYFLMRKKFVLSLVLLLFSVLTKYITLLLFPVFLYFIYRELVSNEKRIKFISKTLLVSLLITSLFYLPYWEGFQIFKGLFLQSDLASFINMSLFPSFIFGGAYLFKNLFSWSYNDIMQIVRYSGILIFAAVYFWQLKRLIKDTRSSGFIYRIFLILLLYSIYAVFYFRPWYFLWILPLAALIDKKYFPHFIFIITIIGLLSYSFVVISILLVLFFVAFLLIKPFVKNQYLSLFLGLK